MALSTFLIHVSSARAAFHHSQRLLGNLAGKLTPQFLYLFSRLREALPFYLFHASIAPRRLVSAFILYIFIILLETFVISPRCYFNVKFV